MGARLSCDEQVASADPLILNPKESGFATGGGEVATRWCFGPGRVIRSGLATPLAGVLASALATRRSPLTPSTRHGGPWCSEPPS